MIIKDSGKQFWTDPVHILAYMYACSYVAFRDTVSAKYPRFRCSTSSSNTGTRYLPKQLVGEEAVNRASDAVLYGTHTVA